MEKLKVHILRRLYRHTYIGRRNHAITDLQKGLPSHDRDMRIIEATVKELLNEGFLILHHTNRVSINPKKLKEVRKEIM
ncbi:MAG: hypothetical protein ABH950_07445 [Candidatus Altiarchaeota archaeon]